MNTDEITAILESGEQTIWQGVINRKVLVLKLLIALTITAIIARFFFSQEIIHYTSNGIPKVASGFTVGEIIVAIGVALSFLIFFSNLAKKYFITNKRVLIKSGIIGTDFTSLYFTQIRNSNVIVGLIGKLFSVGTISIDTGKTETVQSGTGNNQTVGTRTSYDYLSSIDNPYEVYKYFEATRTNREESLYSGRADQETIVAEKSAQ